MTENPCIYIIHRRLLKRQQEWDSMKAAIVYLKYLKKHLGVFQKKWLHAWCSDALRHFGKETYIKQNKCTRDKWSLVARCWSMANIGQESWESALESKVNGLSQSKAPPALLANHWAVGSQWIPLDPLIDGDCMEIVSEVSCLAQHYTRRHVNFWFLVFPVRRN